ncbi:chloramphenicol 3-O phosphotransferase [Vannielia litorea]|uniref:Chloramphenicol 3-O phosphotransferase n=1 Tax=Vannielia litorea TaxID=1217970 RepID=A0A1N6GNR4_9RHOB|nr:chloramphenicol 3-O phosphotransferase [Vannielia litorea]
MPAPGRVILIHGASSAGKSTLARAVQAALPEPFTHLTFDHLIDSGALPRGPRWPAVRAQVFDGWHRAVAAFGASGADVIWDHIIEAPAWHQDLRALLAGRDLFFVGLHCGLAELERRESARGDRTPGDAARDAAHIHAGKSYDIELRSEEGAAANATRLVAAWQARQGVSRFFA